MPDDLKSQWRDQCLRLARRPSDPWSPRKILRDQRMTFVLDDSLGLEDIGYTDLKIKALTRLYVHEESRDVALERWNDRRKGKLTSETFHCFNHLTKLSGRQGKQGPCMLSVVVTDTGREVVANIASGLVSGRF